MGRFADRIRRAHPRPPALTTGTYELVLLPDGLVGHPAATTWRDASGKAGRGATVAGGAAIGRVGHLRGVTLDGVDDYLGGALSLASDRPLAVFTLSQAVTQDSALRVIFEVSDTGATGRALQVIQGNGYRDLRMPPVGSDGDAFYAYSAQTLAVHTYVARQVDRVVREGGRWKASVTNDAGAARAPTVYRIGGALGVPASFWQGFLAAVIVVSGPIAEHDVIAIENWLLDLGRLARPSRYPSAGTFGDLHLVLPATIDAIVGEPVTLFESGDTSVSTALPLDLTYPDRITVTPSAPGDASLSITDGGVQATATVHAVAALAGGAPGRKVLVVGDSNGNQMGAGALEILRAELGASKVTFVGTQGPAQGYHVKHECRDSWGWNTFNNTDPLQPGTLAASPFYQAGVMNLANYIAQLSAPPDIIVWMLGGNDVYGQTLATVDARIDTMLTDAETLWAAWRAACPDVVQIVTSPWVTSADPVVHGNVPASMRALHEVNRRCVQRLEIALAGRSAERLYHRPTFLRVDPFGGYRDAFHMAQSPGAAGVVRALKASLVARWPAIVASITSAVVDGNVGASKLTLTFDAAVHFPDLVGLSLSFTNGTPRTISSLASGNDSTSVVLNLSGAVSGSDVFSVVVGATRTQTTVSGGERISTGTTGVTITNLSNPLLSAPGTPIAIFGGDQLTFSSGSNIDTIIDEGPAGNTVTFLGGVRATQITTAGGHKHIRCAASPNHGWYQRDALAANVPANFSGTIYFAGKVSNWTPSGGYGAIFNVTNTTVEGSGYTSGMFVTPTSGSRWKFGYGADSTLLSTFVAPTDHHVWAWTIEHDVSVKLYKDGTLIDSGVPTPDPVATSVLRLFTLMFNTHTPFEGDIAKLAIFASADASAAHDATKVAEISTYLASLLT